MLNKLFPARESLVDVAVHEVIYSDYAGYDGYAGDRSGVESKEEEARVGVEGVIGGDGKIY